MKHTVSLQTDVQDTGYWLQNIAKVLHIVPARFLHAINSI